jgi:FkbM family methyltransferase
VRHPLLRGALPILGGQLRGEWWLPSSRGRLLQLYLGTYEPEQTAAFLEHVTDGGTFLDIGAHAGYYTLLGAHRVGPTGRVWAFEPEPRNARHLNEHVRLNRLSNVRIEETAVSERVGTARFGGGTGSGTGRLTDAGSLEVPTVTIDDVCRRNGLRPTAIKVDVEGAELAVLEGGEATLRESRPVVFLSTHSRELNAEAIRRMRALGYAVSPLGYPSLEESRALLCLPDG